MFQERRVKQDDRNDSCCHRKIIGNRIYPGAKAACNFKAPCEETIYSICEQAECKKNTKHILPAEYDNQ